MLSVVVAEKVGREFSLYSYEGKSKGRVNFLLTFPVLWEAYRAGHVAFNGAEKNQRVLRD